MKSSHVQSTELPFLHSFADDVNPKSSLQLGTTSNTQFSSQYEPLKKHESSSTFNISPTSNDKELPKLQKTASKATLSSTRPVKTIQTLHSASKELTSSHQKSTTLRTPTSSAKGPSKPIKK